MAMKKLTLAGVPLLAATMTASFTAQALTVDQLNRQVQKLNQRIAAQDQRFRVNGFGSFGLALGSEEIAYDSISDTLDFGRMSKVGIQMTFNMDDKNSVVTQLVSRGLNDWNTEAEWAYFKHDFGNGFTGKLGRIRLPAFMYSEYLDVGYAYHWTEAPRETYESLEPFSNMEGVDLSYSMDIGFNILTLQLAYGRSTSENFDLQELVAVNGNFQADTWNAKLSYSQSSDTSIIGETLAGAVALYGGETEGIKGSFTSLGFTYDPGSIYASTEYTQLEVDGETVDADAGYLALGYRIGRLNKIL